jgi:hypothetical protein
VIAVGRGAGFNQSSETVQVLIDAQTYAFAGLRYVAVKDISVVIPEGQTVTDRAGTVTGRSSASRKRSSTPTADAPRSPLRPLWSVPPP